MTPTMAGLAGLAALFALLALRMPIGLAMMGVGAARYRDPQLVRRAAMKRHGAVPLFLLRRVHG